MPHSFSRASPADRGEVRRAMSVARANRGMRAALRKQASRVAEGAVQMRACHRKRSGGAQALTTARGGVGREVARLHTCADEASESNSIRSRYMPTKQRGLVAANDVLSGKFIEAASARE
ncbi:MAG: hypothetical protein SGPRY_002429 [Prymnesium sp.]